MYSNFVTNVAFGKAVTMSSGWQGDMSGAANLVDMNDSIAHTSCSDAPWMLVDLGSSMVVSKITLLNRKDCCQNRAIGTYVQVLDASKKVVYTSDKIADSNGDTTFSESKSNALAHFQYDITPPSTKVEASSPVPAPVNCAVSEWGGWSDCSATGSQSRTRSVTVNASNGGAGCPELSQTQKCTPPAPNLNGANLRLTWGDGGKVLDSSGGKCNSGTALQSWDRNTAGGQVWNMPGDGTIRSNNTCMDINNSGTANGTAVRCFSCNGSGAQKWEWRWNGTNWTLVNPASGKCLDISGGSMANGARLNLWDCNGAGAQKWQVA